MIRAIIFDLDGTLVQTERLKARSYAQAVHDLCPTTVEEPTVMEAFKDVVGLARREVAQNLMDRFDLTKAASEHMAEFGVPTPWQAFVQLRLQHYERLLADPAVLRSNQWPHAVELLRISHEGGYPTALATMSYCDQVQHILRVLELKNEFNVIATRDDVEHGKPDPEIYRLVVAELDVQPAECLVIEDSPAGVRAALAAGCHVIAVATPFTRARLHAEKGLKADRLIDDPALLAAAVSDLCASSARGEGI